MNTKLKNLLFILILGSVCTFLLISFRNYTLPMIERYHELELKSTILEAGGIPYKEAEIEEVFSKNIREVKKNTFTYYLNPNNLYIFIFEGRGLWGMITGAITLNPDLKTIENLRIISQEETPGLGGRIGEESFLNQFKKKEISPKLFLTTRRKAVKANEVDAITGASLTSQALVDMINQSVLAFREIHR